MIFYHICNLEPHCEDGWESFENSCYKLNHETKDWITAESECASRGAHLASIHSDEEMTFISTLQFPAAVMNVWIGGHRVGNAFVWNDGSDFNYGNWHPNEPNDSGGREDCVEFFHYPGKQNNYKWNDIPCDVTNRVEGYLCKKDKRGNSL